MKIYGNKLEDFFEQNMHNNEKYNIILSIADCLDSLTEDYNYSETEVKEAINNHTLLNLYKKGYTKRFSTLMNNFNIIGEDDETCTVTSSEINLLLTSINNITIKELYDNIISVTNNFEIYNYIELNYVKY